MTTLKKGMPIGITDSAYTSIRVGDTLKNIHSGLLATVNKYGQFICKVTGDKLDRDGSNWTVVDDADDLDFDLDYRTSQEEMRAMHELPEIPAAPVAPSDPANATDTAMGPGAELGEIATAELLAEAKRRTDALSYFTEDEIFAELRSRGFSGTLDQEIRIIKKHTI